MTSPARHREILNLWLSMSTDELDNVCLSGPARLAVEELRTRQFDAVVDGIAKRGEIYDVQVASIRKLRGDLSHAIARADAQEAVANGLRAELATARLDAFQWKQRAESNRAAVALELLRAAESADGEQAAEFRKAAGLVQGLGNG